MPIANCRNQPTKRMWPWVGANQATQSPGNSRSVSIAPPSTIPSSSQISAARTITVVSRSTAVSCHLRNQKARRNRRAVGHRFVRLEYGTPSLWLDDERGHHAEHAMVTLGVAEDVAVKGPGARLGGVDQHLV